MSFGTWLESDYYETRNELPCACGAVFPRHASQGIFRLCSSTARQPTARNANPTAHGLAE